MKTSQLLLCAALVSGVSALAPLRATSLDARVKTSGKEAALNMRGMGILYAVDPASSLFNIEGVTECFYPVDDAIFQVEPPQQVARWQPLPRKASLRWVSRASKVVIQLLSFLILTSVLCIACTGRRGHCAPHVLRVLVPRKLLLQHLEQALPQRM